MNKRRTFSPDFKAERVLEVISGQRSAAEVCREHLLSPPQLSEWKSEFVQNAARLFQRDAQTDAAQVRIAELEQLVGRLTLELEAAKKVSRLLSPAPRRNGRS